MVGYQNLTADVFGSFENARTVTHLVDLKADLTEDGDRDRRPFLLSRSLATHQSTLVAPEKSVIEIDRAENFID
jgi:hypothetical protein